MELSETRRRRWRLVLGAGSEDALGGLGDGWAEREAALGFLYDREHGEGRNVRSGPGSLEASQLTVPDWINQVHELFPKRVIERLEKDALERYGLEELVTNPELLRRAEPSQTLLKAVLRTKHLMNQEVLALARNLVRKVVEQLLEKMAREVRTPFTGAKVRRRSFLPVSSNFDAKETIRRNLKNWDAENQQLVVERPYFLSRKRRHVDKWQLILVIDESGSMMDSVIHAAVTASIFWSLPALKTRLLIFDTSVVDLTDHCADPVETLMKVQLGGGTDIGGALMHAETLIDDPRRAIVILVTDFMEGGPLGNLLGATRRLTESGVHLLGLAALDENADPRYDRETAGKMAALGAHIGAMTPGELAEWVAEKIG